MSQPSSSSPQLRIRGIRGIDRLDSGPRTQTGREQGGALHLGERVAALRDRLEARADAQSAGRLRDDVREARGHVKEWAPSHVSDRTADRYARVVSQMSSTGQKPEDAACKSSFEFRRAAVVHSARVSIKSALTDLDRAKRGGDVDRAADAYNRVKSSLETLRQYPPSTGNRERDLERASAFRGPSRPAAQDSNGKRASLASLPHGWRDDVQKAAREEDRPALAAMSLTGCRPAEIRGIKVRQSADGQSVTLSIKGAKFDEDRGVKVRSIELSKDDLERTQAGRDLTDWLGGRECRTISLTGSVEAFRERISRAADRAGHEEASAYSFRHAEARDLKDSGLEREEIADRLGHRATRSQSVYG